jgi:hypothetical protein
MYQLTGALVVARSEDVTREEAPLRGLLQRYEWRPRPEAVRRADHERHLALRRHPRDELAAVLERRSNPREHG